jgi:hypothetical protein
VGLYDGVNKDGDSVGLVVGLNDGLGVDDVGTCESVGKCVGDKVELYVGLVVGGYVEEEGSAVMLGLKVGERVGEKVGLVLMGLIVGERVLKDRRLS